MNKLLDLQAAFDDIGQAIDIVEWLEIDLFSSKDQKLLTTILGNLQEFAKKIQAEIEELENGEKSS